MEFNVADPRGIKVQFVDEFRAENFRDNFHGEVWREQFTLGIKFVENMVVSEILSEEDDDGDDYDVI
jgi:hypothetical protein